MASEILGLFTTPEQYQLAQRQAQEAQAIQFANLDPMARANYGTFRAGQQLGGAIGGALGGQDPQLQLIARTQQLARSANLADPASLEAVAQQLANIGNMPLAINYADRAKALREEKRKGLESGALISLRGAQAQKAKNFEQQVQVSKENRNIISSIEEKLASDPAYVPTNKEIAQARFILGSEMKTQTLKDTETGALLGTIEGMDINFSAPNLARLLAKQQPVKAVEGEATSVDGVATTSAVAKTVPPVAEAISPVVGATTTTASGLKVTQTPTSIQKEKEQKEKDVAKIEEKQRAVESFDDQIAAVQSLRDTIKTTKGLISPTTTGYGSYLSVLPLTSARTLEGNTQTIKNNVALAKLRELKQQSSTGASGLGALNMKEFDAIQGIIASLDPKSANYASDLDKVDKFFARAEELMTKQSGRAKENLGAGAGSSDEAKIQRFIDFNGGKPSRQQAINALKKSGVIK
jgi:hypothetical protein